MTLRENPEIDSLQCNAAISKVATVKRAAPPRVRKMGVIARIWELLFPIAPIGYEDDEGFHYGKEPRVSTQQRKPASRLKAGYFVEESPNFADVPHTRTGTDGLTTFSMKTI